MSIESNISINGNDFDRKSNEIEINDFIKFIFRNKSIFLKISILSTILGLFLAFNIEKKWKGQFQIVLNSEKSTPSNRFSRNLLFSLPFGDKGEDLKTQVGILKSPSILFNVFEFVKNQKILKNESVEDLNFLDWRRDNLTFFLERDTSILNISYEDKDKELILNVLNLISSKYQEYSQKERLEKLDSKINYLQNQIKDYTAKSNNAYKLVQEFATEQNISTEITVSPGEFPKIDVEEIRLESLRELNEINFRIKRISQLEASDDQLLYIVSGVYESPNSLVYKTLFGIDDKLSSLRSYLKDDDIEIKNLIKKRESLLNIYKKNILGNLNSRKAFLEARINSVKRPEGVLTTFQELIRNAEAAKVFLENLKAELRISLLEKGKNKDCRRSK